MLEIVPATRAHAEAIRLREGDAREVESVGLDLGRMVADSVWCDAYLIDGEIAALMGIGSVSFLSGAAVWMLTGETVERHKKTFLQLTRERTNRMVKEYGTLTTSVLPEYERSIRWLRWLGFEIGEMVMINGMPFRVATMRAV